MQKTVLVIGGTRFFGRLLVQALLDAGHAVTLATRGLAADPFGAQVQRIRVDRRNAAAMHAAFANTPGYDLVYDQMCYSPLDAKIAADVFAGKTRRYVMASTIEVYRALLGTVDRPFVETDWDPLQQAIDLDYPWHDPALAEASYANGKRQAEALLYQDGRLPLVTVRIAHVLGGPEDFTGRLAHYVDLARRQAPLPHTPAAGATSFLSPRAISDFLLWVGAQGFTGSVHAACDGPLSAPALHQRVGAALGVAVRLQALQSPPTPVPAGAAPSPFDYGAPYALDTGRARALGYRFGHVDDWLPGLVAQHASPVAGPVAA